MKYICFLKSSFTKLNMKSYASSSLINHNGQKLLLYMIRDGIYFPNIAELKIHIPNASKVNLQR